MSAVRYRGDKVTNPQNHEVPTRCTRPTIHGVSTYTILGFAGYGVASILAAVATSFWGMTVTDRMSAMVVPPIAFLFVVKLTRRIVGYERIVFYQTACAGVLGAAVASAASHGTSARVLDVAVLGIGTFLVFGRIGCFAVACCHGRPAAFGIIYGPEHVRLGLWRGLVGRRLWPTQPVEAGVSAVLVVSATSLGWHTPGLGAQIYIVGYGLARFMLELVRGDAARPYYLGISEAQWTATASIAACAMWRPHPISIGAAVLCVLGLAALAARRNRVDLTDVFHLIELDRLCVSLRASQTDDRRETSRGVFVSCHVLPDGRIDWVLSSDRSGWSMTAARTVAAKLWPDSEFVEGRLAGVAHVIESR